MKKTLLITAALIVVAAIVAVILFFNGIFQLNNPSRQDFPVRGVDVSSYQGDIDWDTLAAQGIQFAFIKATEGSSFVDPQFAANFANAAKTDLRIGAYHFFSYDSSGQTQADNFIANVSKTDSLPPVIDVEFYGDKEANPPAKADVQASLTALLTRLEEHYDVKPILYATQKSYDLYIAGAFADYDVWIRNVYSTPALSDGRAWTFWQYTDKATLPGTHGEERFIDMNVFAGTAAEFAAYGG